MWLNMKPGDQFIGSKLPNVPVSVYQLLKHKNTAQLHHSNLTWLTQTLHVFTIKSRWKNSNGNIQKKCCWNFWYGLSKVAHCSQWLGIVYYNYNTVVDFIGQRIVNTVTVKKLPHYSNESRINTSHTVEFASKQWHYTVLILIHCINALVH